MKITYNDILDSMKQAFFDECGHNPDNLSDIGARLEAVASEIFSLCCNMDYVKRQSFVQTADGEYLDYHAQLRDMTRKTATKSRGVLTFGISEIIDEDIVIDKGTIVAVKDKPFIQFVTDYQVVLSAGQTSVDVNATALESGRDYNARLGTVSVLVKAPARIEWVTNNNDFVGGNDTESDASLRERIINSFKFLPSGYSKEYMQDMIMTIDEVLDCKIYDAGNDEIGVIVKTSTGMISTNLGQRLDEKTLPLRLINKSCVYSVPIKKDVDITVYSNKASDDVAVLCKEYFDKLCIGEALDLLSLRIWLSKQLDFDIYDVISPQAVGQYVLCGNTEYLSLGDVGVIDDE